MDKVEQIKQDTEKCMMMLEDLLERSRNGQEMKQRKPCKYWEDCTNKGHGLCRQFHPKVKECKYGLDCKFIGKTCKFFHKKISI